SHASTLNTNNNYRFMTTKVPPSNAAMLPSSLAPNRSMHCAASSLFTLLNLPPPSMSSLHSSGVLIQLLSIGKTPIKRFA
ncbi:hypothetical protein PIB30_115432, partial [Stylosanthes scabra]|nr:hypothetical protein [Stylosanthes scabra]